MSAREKHAAYWRERIAGFTDDELNEWIGGLVDTKFKARLVADPNTLLISKVNGKWPKDRVVAAVDATTPLLTQSSAIYTRRQLTTRLLDALLGQQ